MSVTVIHSYPAPSSPEYIRGFEAGYREALLELQQGFDALQKRIAQGPQLIAPVCVETNN